MSNLENSINKISIVLKIGFLSKRKMTFQINFTVVEKSNYLVTILAMKATKRSAPVEEETFEGLSLDISISNNQLRNISKWPFFWTMY